MKGFGETSKNIPQKRSKKISRLSPDQIKSRAVKFHLEGNLDQAQKFYEVFLETGIDDPDVYSNYALICQDNGKINKALQMYKKCIDIKPNHSFASVNLAHLYLQLDRLPEAEALIYKVIDIKPNFANAYSCLALILKEKLLLNDALVNIEKAISLDPKLVDARINLGLILMEQGNFIKAESTFEGIIKQYPDNASAYLNLGVIYKELGKLDQAEKVTRISLKLLPSIKDANMNLGAILQDKNNLEEALRYALKEISNYPEKQSTYLLLHSILREANPETIPVLLLRKSLGYLLNRKDIAHKDLFLIINFLVDDSVLTQISSSKTSVLALTSFRNLISDTTVIKSLGLLTFNNLTWELALTRIRRDICLSCFELPKEKRHDLTRFTISLAEQCFLNEYVFSTTDDEILIVQNLLTKAPLLEIDDFQIALLCCYKALFEVFEESNRNSTFFSGRLLIKDLVDLQYREPHHEKRISKSIRVYGNITDKTSFLVKQQYELNPYPRWRYTSNSTSNKIPVSSAINQEIHPNRIRSFSTEKRIQLLIAGCGTGLQVLDSYRYENVEITAIDISLASISYAKRKAIEYEIDNIEFIQMDILDLPKMSKTFDLIECSGVLHHMDQPSKGLSSLVQILNNKGFMKLGLYSEMARRNIVLARELITQANLRPTSEDIRLFREKILSNVYPEIKSISLWSDFFTISMCRDLCFHIKEHRFDISKLNTLLNSHGLNFLGFILPKQIKESFAIEFPNDICQLNLNNWSEFEESNPDTFRSMYQFWVSK